MKKLAIVVMVAGLGLVGSGCTQNNVDWGSTPAYSSRENNQRIMRNWNYEGAQMVDDVDSALLLVPASGMTMWNVRTPYP